MTYRKSLTTLLFISIITVISIGLTGFNSIKQGLIEAKKQDIAAILHMATNKSSEFINQYQQGILTKQQAEQKIIEFLSALNYNDAYIWANDNNAIARVHIRPEIIGRYQKSYIKHITALEHSTIFYILDTNIKPSTSKRTIKINGAIKLPQWNWVIGFGVYLDDINKILFHYLLAFVASILISIIVLVLAFYYFINKTNPKNEHL